MAYLFMEEVDERDLISFTGTTRSPWFKLLDDTWVKIKEKSKKKCEVECSTWHLNVVDKNIKFTREDMKDNRFSLPGLCSVAW